jgi:predicted solute-binding protein
MKKLPASIKRLFWDVDKESVDIEKHWSFIISRIMDYGNCRDIQWMKQTYTDDQIKEVVCKRKGLSKKSAYFWAAYYKIPKEEVRCLQEFFPKELRVF